MVPTPRSFPEISGNEVRIQDLMTLPLTVLASMMHLSLNDSGFATMKNPISIDFVDEITVDHNSI